MIANKNLDCLIDFAVVAKFLKKFAMQWIMCEDELLMFSQDYFITVQDDLTENYLAIDLFEVSSCLTIQGSELVGICLRKNILKISDLPTLDDLNKEDMEIFLSEKRLKLSNLISNFTALYLLFDEIKAVGLEFIEKSGDLVTDRRTNWRKFDPVFKSRQFECIKDRMPEFKMPRTAPWLSAQ